MTIQALVNAGFVVAPQHEAGYLLGGSKRAGVLGIMKTYAFSFPLIFILPFFFSEWGIWYAAPSAEFLALLLTIFVLSQRYRSHKAPLGLFFKALH